MTDIPLSDIRLLDAPRGLDPRELPAGGWHPAVVPGGVHETLLAAGVIDTPYRDGGEEAVRWIEKRDWWYRATLPAVPSSAGERVDLIFEGIDTVAEIWVEGERIGAHANMFRPAVFDVTRGSARPRELLVRVSPPLAGIEPDEFVRRSAGPVPISPVLAEAAYRRKALFSWGWDFAPRVASIGLWQPVRLTRRARGHLTGHHVRTREIRPDGAAVVEIDVDVERLDPSAALEVEVVLADPSDVVQARTVLAAADGDTRARFVIDDAQLWWTHDLGHPARYTLSLTLREGEHTIDRVEERVGLRTIELDRSPDPQGGRLFRFVLNGVPTFARGASWVPADMLVGSVPTERYEALIDGAVEANMTMIRVWGGGVYEPDEFYRTCDERGVLVWQDFMFACVQVPENDAELVDEIVAEARHQVRRLRNHPSLALWGGNNEVQMFREIVARYGPTGEWGERLFHDILPAVVAEEDGITVYWPGSPWGEEPGAVNGVLDGDRHAWEVWHGGDLGVAGGPFGSLGEERLYRRYADDTGKFISEFGINSAPTIATLRDWADGALESAGEPGFEARMRGNPPRKHDPVLSIVTGIPESAPGYVAATQISQAEGLKFGIEHYRRRQPHCGGTLVWQLNDPWPGFSWSLIDHSLRRKPAFHVVRRAYAPVLASFRRDDGALALWVTNSRDATVEGTARVSIVRFDGIVLHDVDVDYLARGGESRVVWHMPDEDFGPDVVAWVESPQHAFPANRLFFGEIRDLPLEAADLEVSFEPSGAGEGALVLRSSSYAYLVELDAGDRATRFSDNAFDVLPGRAVRVAVTGVPEGFDARDVSVGSAWDLVHDLSREPGTR